MAGKRSYIGTDRDLNPGMCVEMGWVKNPCTFEALSVSCDMKLWAKHHGYKNVSAIKNDNNVMGIFRSKMGDKAKTVFYYIERFEVGKVIKHVWA